MSKISKIKISNLKSISEIEVDFKGCTAIITAGNNQGKTTLIRSIPDRIRYIRPEVMVKQGSTKGKGELTLDTGEQFIWNFDTNGKDTLKYITEKGIDRPLTVELGQRFFPPVFDVDKFLASSPQKQSKELQKLVGVDFTDVDARYKSAYDARTSANKEAERLNLMAQVTPPEKVDPVDLTDLQTAKEAEKTRLNKLYTSNKDANTKARNDWEESKKGIDKEVSDFNKLQSELTVKYNACFDAHTILKNNGYNGKEVQSFLDACKEEIKPQKVAALLYTKEPTYINEMPDSTALDKIDEDILGISKTNQKAQEYANYISFIEQSKAATKEAVIADDLVKSIVAEKNKMIEGAKFPKGISVTPDGITVDGLPFDRNQLSASKLTITALQFAAMNLGEVRMLCFDASPLDRNGLKEVEQWGYENGLQLLIERPDFDGGQITYELIENENADTNI